MPMRSRLALLCKQVLENKPVQTRQGGGRAGAPAPRVSECLVGDESGTMYFTARNEQGARFKQSPRHSRDLQARCPAPIAVCTPPASCDV